MWAKIINLILILISTQTEQLLLQSRTLDPTKQSVNNPLRQFVRKFSDLQAGSSRTSGKKWRDPYVQTPGAMARIHGGWHLEPHEFPWMVKIKVGRTTKHNFSFQHNKYQFPGGRKTRNKY